MNTRNTLDVSAYFIVGPENTKGKSVAESIQAVVNAGYSCIQIRAKTAGAREIIELTRRAADIIAAAGRSNTTSLLVNDRLDVALAARAQGIKVDGVHVGQNDIPVAVCRKYLGSNAIIGLSARAYELMDYIKTADVSQIDYFGTGPLHQTPTKPDSGLAPDGKRFTRNLSEITQLAQISPIPVVVGGGVKLADIPSLAKTGIHGFFVITAISQAYDPYTAAKNMLTSWKEHKQPPL